MKYEAKNVGGIATSQELLTPWTGISYSNAYNNCSDLGINYSLISNVEWMTIARDIESNSNNWISGVLKRGNVGVDSLTSYDGPNPDFGAGRNLTSSLELTNGETIWDLSGNVFEWIDFTSVNLPISGRVCNVGSDQFIQFSSCIFESPFNKTNAIEVNYEVGLLGNYNSTQGVGEMYVVNSGSVVRYPVRGGHWSAGNQVSGILGGGIYRTDFDYTGGGGGTRGFRCVYTP